MSKDRHDCIPVVSFDIKIGKIFDKRLDFNPTLARQSSRFLQTDCRRINRNDIVTMFCKERRVTALPLGNTQGSAPGYVCNNACQKLVWLGAINIFAGIVSFVPLISYSNARDILRYRYTSKECEYRNTTYIHDSVTQSTYPGTIKHDEYTSKKPGENHAN